MQLKIKQSPMLNSLFKKIPHQGAPTLGNVYEQSEGFSIPIVHDLTISESSLEVKLKDFTNDSYKMNASVFMVLDMLIIMHTNFPGANLSLDLDQFIKWRGLSENSRKYARKELMNALKALNNIIISYKTNSSYYTDLDNIPIFETDAYIKNSLVHAQFSKGFEQHLNEAMIMEYPEEIFKFSVKKNPLSYALFRKMIEHAHMNKNKKNKNIMKIQTLYDVHPSLMPYKMFSEFHADADFRKKVIKPILRDVQATGKEIEILNSNREIVPSPAKIVQRNFDLLFIKFGNL